MAIYGEAGSYCSLLNEKENNLTNFKETERQFPHAPDNHILLETVRYNKSPHVITCSF